MPEVGARFSVGKEFVRTTRARIAALVGLGAAGLVAAACTEGPGFFAPDSAAPQGRDVDQLYFVVFLIAVGVFVIVEGLLLWIVLRYRRRPVDGELPPQTHGNNFLEILWTAIPALIVTWLFVITVDTLGRVDSLEPEPQGVEVNVIGFQWQWTFEYPNEGLAFTGAGAVGPTMVIPVGEPVRVRLEARDVVHSFYVPMFRYKKDNVPGRINEFDIVVDQPGTYAGQCAEFCGLLHYDMHFTVEAVSRTDYDAWVAEQQAAPQPTPGEPPAEGHHVTLASPDFETFDPPNLTAPADTPIIFDFRNTDPAQPHNVSIVGGLDGEDWHGEPIADPNENLTYVSPPLAAGTYEFYCRVHPTTMRGTLTVGQ